MFSTRVSAGMRYLRPLGHSLLSRGVISRFKHTFDFDVYKPGQSFLEKSPNNPDEPIIYLHDFLSLKEALKTEANDMCQTLETTVYCVNLRDHSSKMSEAEGEFSLTALTNDLIDFFNKNGLGKAILVGQGLGGNISMRAALSGKIDVSKLVSIESFPAPLKKESKEELGHFIKGLQYIVNESGIPKKDKEYLEKCAEILRDKFRISDSSSIQFLLKNVDNSGTKGTVGLKVPINSIAESGFLEEYLNWDIQGARFPNPTLFIMGRNSVNYPKSLEEKTAIKELAKLLFPDSSVKEFTGSRFVASEQLTHVVNAICQFLLKESDSRYDEMRGFTSE